MYHFCSHTIHNTSLSPGLNKDFHKGRLRYKAVVLDHILRRCLHHFCSLCIQNTFLGCAVLSATSHLPLPDCISQKQEKDDSMCQERELALMDTQLNPISLLKDYLQNNKRVHISCCTQRNVRNGGQ